MLSKLKEIFSRLSGEGATAPDAAASAAAEVEYKGYLIRPTPYKNKGQYQTSGTIRKETPEGTREHKFIRADTYASLDDANAFTIMKAKQLIDQGTTDTFEPAKYKDTVRERVLEAIQGKVEGHEITTEPAQDGGGKIIDLMEALKASLAQAGGDEEAEEAAPKKKAKKAS